MRPRMQNICQTHMKYTHLRWRNVCDAYVKRMCSASENICEPYVKHVKHMRNTYDTLTYFATGLRCVYVLLMYMFANLCVFCWRRPYFVQITQGKALFWNACRKKINRNINNTQTRTQTHFVTFFAFVHVYGLCFLMLGKE